MTDGSLVAPSPVLSLILCSRNDQYMGNSRWRLETTLNYLGQIVHELSREKHVEVLVADWASERPLEEDLRLTPFAARITSFLAVPNAIACEVQGDSEFPEVIALNAAARRARGEYIGRIDQDTLVGSRFLEVFFDLYESRRELNVPLSNALLFSNRRSVPYRFAVRCPPLANLRKLIACFGAMMRVQASPRKPIWRSPVGIWLVHRDLWTECGGYEERMIYLNDMEENMVVRLMQRHEVVDLGKSTNYAFFHLEHKHPWDGRKAARNRKVNDKSFKTPALFLANGENWGLRQYVLEVKPARAAIRQTDRRWLGLVEEWTAFIGGTLLVGSRIALDALMRSVAGRWLFQNYCRWRSRIGNIRKAVARQPASSWPGIVGRLWVGRGSRP
jgi:hypothetical protein